MNRVSTSSGSSQIRAWKNKEEAEENNTSRSRRRTIQAGAGGEQYRAKPTQGGMALYLVYDTAIEYDKHTEHQSNHAAFSTSQK